VPRTARLGTNITEHQTKIKEIDHEDRHYDKDATPSAVRISSRASRRFLSFAAGVCEGVVSLKLSDVFVVIVRTDDTGSPAERRGFYFFWYRQDDGGKAYSGLTWHWYIFIRKVGRRRASLAAPHELTAG